MFSHWLRLPLVTPKPVGSNVRCLARQAAESLQQGECVEVVRFDSKKARPSPAAVAIVRQDPIPMLLGLGEAEKVAASSACQDNGLPHPPLSVAAEKYFPIGGAVDIPNLAASV